MDKLNFPIFKEPLPPARILSMDDYLKFVHMYRRSILNRRDYAEQKEKRQVNVPFRLK